MARGDHLFVYCAGYSHHGIDDGGGAIIHFDTGPWRKAFGDLAGGSPDRIRRTTWEQFSKGRAVIVRKYEECDDVETVLRRAESRVGDEGYHLFGNNCEHFAVWCKTGRSHSTQVDALVEAAKPMSTGMAASAVLLRGLRFLPPQLRLFASGAAVAVTAGAAANRYFQRREEHARQRLS